MLSQVCLMCEIVHVKKDLLLQYKIKLVVKNLNNESLVGQSYHCEG